MTVTFNQEGFAENSGEITVYCTDNNGIYSHRSTEYVSEGGSLSAGSYLDAPPQPKQGFVIVRADNSWQYQSDHRGIYYSKETGEKVEHTALGELPEKLTALAPLAEPCKWNGTGWVKDEAKIVDLFMQRKEALLATLANKADTLKSSLLVGYPQTEIESFYRQEKEALAWKADNKADTPMLKQIARVRGVPFDVLVEKVIEKASQFAVAIGLIIGQRQAFEDRLLATKTLEELTALEKEIEEWKFQAN
jgi:hypothetical protein|nr:MAG TPA: tail fiber assembly protein [Caudoviricetes sp.]